VAVLTGGKEMTKEMRHAVLERFRKGQDKVLITTNVLARGIDVMQISMVRRLGGCPQALSTSCFCFSFLLYSSPLFVSFSPVFRWGVVSSPVCRW
jgi:hypothetical protein